MPTQAPNPFSRQADPQSLPVNLESPDCHAIHLRVPFIQLLLSVGLSSTTIENQNQYLYVDIYLHCPHFMGTTFLSGALKSFHSGPFVLHSAISGPLLAQFSLQYIPNLLVAPKIHILTMHLLLGLKKKITALPHK